MSKHQGNEDDRPQRRLPLLARHGRIHNPKPRVYHYDTGPQGAGEHGLQLPSSPKDDTAAFSPLPESWHPHQHPIDSRILEYRPGHRLVYEKRASRVDAALTVTLVTFLTWAGGLLFQAGAVGLLLGLVLSSVYVLYRWKSGEYMVHRWEWNFPQRKLQQIVGDRYTHHPLQNIDSVRVQLKQRNHRWSSSLSEQRNTYSYPSYHAEISLVSPHEDQELLIASTAEYNEDPTEPRLIGLSFGHMLATQLELPLQFDDTLPQSSNEEDTRPSA